MRSPALALPALVLLMACGSDKLTPSLAEKLIAPDYPVVVAVKVPKHASAEKGSAELTKIESINALLAKTQVITIERRENGSKVEFRYGLAPGAPASVKTTDKGFEVPAAEATFVKALRSEGSGGHYRVTYQIRLAKPTAHYPLFQFLHPTVRIGDTHDRQAEIQRQGDKWALMNTNETYKTKD